MAYKTIIVICVQLTLFSQANYAKVWTTFLQTLKIIDCPFHCSSCVDLETCLTCYPGYGLQNDKCATCPPGTYLDSQSCLGTFIIFFLLIILDCPLTCSVCSDSSTCTNCHNGYGLVDHECINCPDDHVLIGIKCQYQPTTAVITQDAIETSQIASRIAGLVAAGSPMGITAGLSGKIFSQIKYLDINYSEELREAFALWDLDLFTLGLDFEMPSFLLNQIEDRELPILFEKYSVNSSYLLNFWSVTIMLMIFTLIYCFTKIVELAAKVCKSQYLPYKGAKTIRVIIQNFLFIQIYNLFGESLFYSVLDWRSINLERGTAWLSLFLSLSYQIIIVGTLIFHFKLILSYQAIKKKGDRSCNKRELEQFSIDQAGNQFLFRDFKDNGFILQGFLFYFTLRDLLLNLVFTTLNHFPLIQTTLLLATNIIMIVYLILKQPFIDKLDFIQQIFFEVFVFVVNSSICIMALCDAHEFEAIGLRIALGKVIIIISMVFFIVTIIFVIGRLVISIVQSMKMGYNFWKSQRMKNLNEHKLKVRPSGPKQIKDLANKEKNTQASSPLNNSSIISLNQNEKNLFSIDDSIGFSSTFQRNSFQNTVNPDHRPQNNSSRIDFDCPPTKLTNALSNKRIITRKETLESRRTHLVSNSSADLYVDYVKKRNRLLKLS